MLTATPCSSQWLNSRLCHKNLSFLETRPPWAPNLLRQSLQPRAFNRQDKSSALKVNLIRLNQSFK